MSTAIRLARQGRGDATVSETLNSNNINLVGGIVIPATILGSRHRARRRHHRSGVARRTRRRRRLAVALASRGGMRRLAGIALVGAYRRVRDHARV